MDFLEMEDVCREVASCAHGVSSRAPGRDAVDHARITYFGYAAAIGRALPLTLRHDAIAGAMPRRPEGDLPCAGGIT